MTGVIDILEPGRAGLKLTARKLQRGETCDQVCRALTEPTPVVRGVGSGVGSFLLPRPPSSCGACVRPGDTYSQASAHPGPEACQLAFRLVGMARDDQVTQVARGKVRSERKMVYGLRFP